MMKIHSTQDLNSLAQSQRPNAKLSQTRDFRSFKKEYEDKEQEDALALSFKGKMPLIIKKVARSTEKPSKILKSKWFRDVLDFMDHEVLVQAMISAMVCMVLRPLTIMGLSVFNEKSKKDNAYASAHSFASGVAGIAASVLISFGFSKSLHNKSFTKYANRMISKNKDITKLKNILLEMRPDIDIKTVYNEATGKVNEKELWRTVDGKRIASNMKDVMTVARPTHYSDCSKETFKDFGVNIDLEKQKGKKLFDMTTTDGKKVLEVLKAKDMFIAVKEEGMGGSHKGYKDTNFFSLKYIDKEFLKKLDSSVDIKSMEKDGQRLHPTKWLKTDGSKWLDETTAENIHLPSFRETPETTPIYTGARRPGDENKYASYLSNIENYKLGDVPDELGTIVTNEYLEADKITETKERTIKWLPDLLTRPLVAATTIAIIPWVLKNVFGIEKKANKKEEQTNSGQVNKVSQKQEDKNNVTFKGAGGIGDKIGEFYAKWFTNSMLYGKPWVTKLANRINNLPGNSVEHVAALGSVITSGTYMYKTYTNDKLEKENRTTLVLNQGACCLIPTVAAYFVNHKLTDRVKRMEYQLSGAMKELVQGGQVSEAEYKKFAERLPKRLKSMNALASLATFTLIYRYATPVLVTPAANWVSEKWRAYKKNKRKSAQEIQMNSQDKSKDLKEKSDKKVA